MPSKQTRAAKKLAPAKKKAPTKTAATKAIARKLAPRLELFVATEAPALVGRSCWGLPGHEAGATFRLELVPFGDRSRIDADDEAAAEGWLPFARAGKRRTAALLLVASAAPFPVGIWEHDTDAVIAVWPSLDVFLGELLSAGETSPLEQLASSNVEASALVDANKHREAMDVLASALARVTRVPEVDLEAREAVAEAHYHLGTAHRGLGQHTEALAAFTRADALGDDHACLDELSLLLDELADPARAAERGTELDARRHLGAEGRIWVARYLAEAHLRLGRVELAEQALRKVVTTFETREPKLLLEVRASLEELARAGVSFAPDLRTFLAWFRPKDDTTSLDEAARNRAWFESLPEPIRQVLAEAGTSDVDIARALDVELLWLHAPLYDVRPLLVFRKLKVLFLAANPTSLDPLRELPALTRLRVGVNVIDVEAWRAS